ncbi:MAG: anhydro-N-acetylmuramic acid kinase, partial [Cyanobacteria bacterium]|nr:anhydro-N-acetylmuramic acid kinase [Cyanobacteriota bacterium]
LRRHIRYWERVEMQERNFLLAVGVMTGNSLDGVDTVLTKFSENGEITDLKSHGLTSPTELTEHLKQLRATINECSGDMALAEKTLAERGSGSSFDEIQSMYIRFVAQAVKELIALAKEDEILSAEYDFDQVDLVGFHGQTCAHFPPSIAKTADPTVVYTCQIGDGQQLADLLGITVVYDFRSDDLMNGGEAAPLAPLHHQHLAELLRQRGQFPIAFCNAGNTGNFTAISTNKENGEVSVLGWDVGPFNNYPDKLMQLEHGKECDLDGLLGSNGRISLDLLRKLFESAVVTQDGRNFLHAKPPKSSDPQWYRLIPELKGETEIAGQPLSFEDRLRTVEYFSAYIYVYALTMIPQNVNLPVHYALCGGGWKNPVPRNHFIGLIQADYEFHPVLPEHTEEFQNLRCRYLDQNETPVVALSENYGFDGTAMEARIFADAAVCRVKGQPFTTPSTTGARGNTICGVIRFPGRSQSNATATLETWLRRYNSRDLTIDKPSIFDNRWSRAVAGWQTRLSPTT